MNNGGAILVHSRKGMNRSVTLALAYLMQKYNWTLEKAEKYYKSKVHKDDIYEVKEWFLKQLRDFENYLRVDEKRELSNDFVFQEEVNTEEQMMVNTWLNSQNLNPKKNDLDGNKKVKKKRNLTWAQEVAQLIPLKENLNIDLKELKAKGIVRERNQRRNAKKMNYNTQNLLKRGSTPAKISSDLGRRIRNLKSILNKKKKLSKVKY